MKPPPEPTWFDRHSYECLLFGMIFLACLLGALLSLLTTS